MANNTSASHGCTIYLSTALVICKTSILLPLSILVLHHGLQQWQRQSSFKSASHSDMFSYHMVVIEIISMPGYLFALCGAYINHATMRMVGQFLASTVVYGELFFHVLTCVERYLAVVHPVTYQGLRNARGVRIRNISVACVWLATICSVCGDLGLYPNVPVTKSACYLSLCLSVVLFCSFSVLYVLIRRPPGDIGTHRKKVNQSRKRALSMMMKILSVQVIFFIGMLISMSFDSVDEVERCVMMTCISWLQLPCTCLLPLLYLHRKGQLSWFTSSKRRSKGF